MLHRVLSSEDYALALTPGFFGFYGHIGVLKALEETNCLRPSHVSGSSAGALVGGFLSAGRYFLLTDQPAVINLAVIVILSVQE